MEARQYDTSLNEKKEGSGWKNYSTGGPAGYKISEQHCSEILALLSEKGNRTKSSYEKAKSRKYREGSEPGRRSIGANIKAT